MDVLIIEDQDDLSAVWAEYLRRAGHAVTVLRSRADALAWLDGGWRADVALVDWSLPDGDAGAILDALRPPCRVAVTTGHGDDVTDAIRSRVERVIRKPFPLRDLRAWVEQAS